MTGTPPSRFVLRHLPVSARIAISAFLLSVGLGYVSALVQLHYQDAQKGELMPTSDDAIKKFHGQIGRAVSRMELLINADEKEEFGSKSMRPGFTNDDGGRKARKAGNQKLLDQREGERQAILAWLRSGAKEEAYTQDKFVLPTDWKKEQPLTEKMTVDDGKAVKIKSILTARCARCHNKDEPDDAGAEPYPLTKWDEIKPYVTAQKTGPTLSITKLAQSSHVHMLGFAMLYGLTGILLALTTYPAFIRVCLCPLPLVVQAVDISCWWLARLEAPYGVWAAQTIPITGGIVALGVFLHIVLTTFDLYGVLGKVVLLIVFSAGGAGGFFFVKPIIEKELKDEKPAAVEKKESADPKKDDKKDPEKDPKVETPKPEVEDQRLGKIEKLLTADPTKKLAKDGQMRTPFHTDSVNWKDLVAMLVKEKQLSEAEVLKQLLPEREGERLALLKWVQAGGPKKAYDDNSFTLPDDWNKDQPITPKYVLDAGKAVKITSIIMDRCVACHGPENAQDDLPLDKYEFLKKYIRDPSAKPK